eukprot:TRINITY_DN4853_c0_g1_i4.p1 TRINITY_DN4853_c0_g1~~TRINITY_DN4853_c0_g1_i4.p1  ORF type:complete len:317 (-),score=92.46 TRINITY_DN4853_c0_g1_i4:38-988(-)
MSGMNNQDRLRRVEKLWKLLSEPSRALPKQAVYERVEEHFADDIHGVAVLFEFLVRSSEVRFACDVYRRHRNDFEKDEQARTLYLDYILAEVKRLTEDEPAINVPPLLTSEDEFGPSEGCVSLKQLGLTEKSAVYISGADRKIVDTAFEKLLAANAIALEVKWVPRIGGRARVSLLQVATRNETYLFDYKGVVKNNEALEFGSRFSGVLNSRRITKVVFDFDETYDILIADNFGNYYLKDISNVLDLRYDKKVNPNGKRTTKALVEEVFGYNLDQIEKLSYWDRRPLRKAQLHYAALETILYLQIHDKFFQKREYR